MKYSRSLFLKTLSLGGLAATTNLIGASPRKQFRDVSLDDPVASNLTLGLASYSTRELSLEETLATAKRLDLKKIAIKSMHMPLDSSEEEIKNILEKCDRASLSLYGAGVIYMKTAEEVENAFRYAKAAKMEVIIGVPDHSLLKLVERKVKETNIKVAIHNHGPGDEVYPTPKVVYDKVKSLDSRIGLCIDIGHVQRLGLDPALNITTYADRLFDIHLKDVDKASAEGKSVEFGRGVINIPAVIKALRKIDYSGVMALEFEKDASDVLPGLSECVGYARGILDS